MRYSLYDRRYAVVLAIVAPLSAVLSLGILRSVWAVFGLYQVTCCLVLPAIDTLVLRPRAARGLGGRTDRRSRDGGHARDAEPARDGRPAGDAEPARDGRHVRAGWDVRGGWRAHGAVLGLRVPDPGTTVFAVILGLATAAVVAWFLALTAELSHPADRVRTAMTLWGITAGGWPWVKAFMLTLHAPAEELFWRGYLQTRLVHEPLSNGNPERLSRVCGSPASPGSLASPSGLESLAGPESPETPESLESPESLGSLGSPESPETPGSPETPASAEGALDSQGRGPRSSWRRAAPRIAILALLYASYHAVTLGSLVPSPLMALAMFAGIWAAGVAWGWLRWRTGSVWPAVLSHLGAVAVYVGFVP